MYILVDYLLSKQSFQQFIINHHKNILTLNKTQTLQKKNHLNPLQLTNLPHLLQALKGTTSQNQKKDKVILQKPNCNTMKKFFTNHH